MKRINKIPFMVMSSAALVTLGLALASCGSNGSKISGTDFVKKSTTYYYGFWNEDNGNADKSTTIDCYYQNDDGICYVDCLTMYNMLANEYSSDPSVFTNTMEGGVLKVDFLGQDKIHQSLTLDANTNVVTISSPNFYTFYFDGEGVSEGEEYREEVQPFTQTSFSFDLDDYGLTSYYMDNAVVLPLSIYDLIFTMQTGFDFYYVNGEVHCDAGTFNYAGSSLEYCTQSIRDLSYNYLRLFFHQYYGLAGYKGLDTIDDVDNFLAPYKTALLATYYQTFEQAEQDIFTKLLDDPHSGINHYSIYNNSNYKPTSNYGTRVITLSETNSDYSDARESALKKYDFVDLHHKSTYGNPLVARVYKDTAYIIFDSFEYDSKKTAGADKDRVDSDMFSLVYFALEEIDKYSTTVSQINNVVVDLSCNTGGYVISGLELLSFMTNDTITWTYRDMDYGSYAHTIANVDNDLDGDLYDDDAHTQYNWYIQTSASSFSCGNLVPFIAKEYGYAKIIGQTSGGGMAVVGTGVLPDGTYFQSSLGLMINTGKTGVDLGQSCEDGVTPNKNITTRKFYDYDYIDTVIAALNGSN